MQIGLFKGGRVAGIEPRPGWPDPWYLVQLEGERDPSRCLPKYMKPSTAAPRPASGGMDRTIRAEEYRAGDRVQCDAMQIGLFKNGRVTGIEPRPGWPDPWYLVQLEGERDPSRCLPKYMKPGAAAPQPAAVGMDSGVKPAAVTPASLCVVGNKIEAAMGISWYEATVLAAPDAQGKCLVHYDGYPPLYDIPVGDSSLRPRGSGPIVKPDKPWQEPTRGGGLKTGEYACYGSGGSVLAGLGFKVLDTSRYTDLDGKSPGTYSVSGDQVNFHGGHLDGQAGRNLKNGQFQIGKSITSCEPWQ